MILIACSTMMYVGTVATVTRMDRAVYVDFWPPLWVSLIACVPIGLTIVPIYRWVRVGVNELLYALHDNEYGVVSQLNQQLDASMSPDAILPAIAETIARTLKLPYVSINTNSGEQVIWGSPADSSLIEMELMYRDAVLGYLQAGTRLPNVPLSVSDVNLLNALGRQVGITLYAARLKDDLQALRERIVIAREEERRRIRNDLHDGLAPTLSSLQLQLGAMRNLIHQDPDQAEAAANELREDLRNATAEIRRLVYNLRPPALDDLGLLGAIQSHAQKFSQLNGLSVSVNAPELPALPAAVEVAALRIAHEAVMNVARHAQARHCVISFTLHDDALVLEIRDDGCGLSPDKVAGVGLSSMRERAEELGGDCAVLSPSGGGALVRARLPLRSKTWTSSAS